jgi:2Fe-2S ferredoxin
LVRVTFIEPDGTARSIDVEPGCSLMEIAVKNRVRGIIAECGGVCSCGTCRVNIEDEIWRLKTGQAHEEERDMMEFVGEHDRNARLSCQIHISGELDGLIVRVPERQR